MLPVPARVLSAPVIPLHVSGCSYRRDPSRWRYRGLRELHSLASSARRSDHQLIRSHRVLAASLWTFPPPATGNIGTALVGGLTNGVSYTFTAPPPSRGERAFRAFERRGSPFGCACAGSERDDEHRPSVSTTPTQATYTINVTNPITATLNSPATVPVNHTLSPDSRHHHCWRSIAQCVYGYRHNYNKRLTRIEYTATVLQISFSDASFNGTFTIQDVPICRTTLTYALRRVLLLTSGSGTVTGPAAKHRGGANQSGHLH